MKERNCGVPYPIYPMMGPMMGPNMMGPNMYNQQMPTTQQMVPNYNSGNMTLENQINNLSNRVSNLEQRLSNLENSLGNNYNTSNFQMI